MPNALLEVGPGTTLSLLAAQSKQKKPVIINSLPGENAEEGQDLETILEAYGQLWTLGSPLKYPEAFGAAGAFLSRPILLKGPGTLLILPAAGQPLLLLPQW